LHLDLKNMRNFSQTKRDQIFITALTNCYDGQERFLSNIGISDYWHSMNENFLTDRCLTVLENTHARHLKDIVFNVHRGFFSSKALVSLAKRCTNLISLSINEFTPEIFVRSDQPHMMAFARCVA